MSYKIEFAEVAYDELVAIRAFHRSRIADAIMAQLAHEPVTNTRNRKLLGGVQPTFEHEPPIWELRVGEYRVYYDVDAESMTVSIRAVRKKPPHSTTEQIL